MESDIATDSQDQQEDTPASLTEKWWLVPETQEERDALRARNMLVFEKKYKSVYDTLVKFEPKSELVFDDEGRPDMMFSGRKFYDGNIDQFTERQLATYWRNPNRLAIYPPMPQHMDMQVGRRLTKMLMRMRDDAGIDFSTGRSSPAAFYTIVMGIGLGRHLPDIIEKTECRNIFLLEPNFEGLYHSLELLDWAALVLEMQARNGDVFFYITGTSQNWMDGLRFQTRYTNTNSLDGTYVYAHYNNPAFVEFSAKFNKESQLLLTGLGFFYDEQIMLRNTYDNLKDDGSRVYIRNKRESAKQVPAVIVGCGPSLDKNIEDIRRISDRAVIFSCGSALGPLMDAGIRPDFQLELENIAVMRVMQYASERHDLSGICLVSSSTVEREIKDFFDTVVFYFRPALCPYPVFSNNPESCLAHPDPTVVNVGLSFAQEMGFQEFYFFGTDLGQKDSDQHHAKSSFHYSDKAKNEVLQVFNIEVPANFGGKAKTSSGLFWALDTVQRAILYSGPRCRYYNCSNGVRINKAIPKLSRTLDLPEPPISRDAAVQDIIESFPLMTHEEFNERWQPERMIREIDKLIDELIDIIETKDLVNSTDHMIDAARMFYTSGEDTYQTYASLVMRGSVNQVFIAADYYLTRITNEELAAKGLAIVREEAVELLEHLRKVVTKHIRSQAAGLELREEYLRGDDDDDGLTDEQREMLLSPAE